MGNVIEQEKIAKLPRWAQDHIRNLQRQIEAFEETRAPHSDSKTQWGYGRFDNMLAQGHIPDHVPVQFIIDDKQNRYFDVRLTEDNELDVHSHPMVEIEPVAANRIILKLRDR